MIKKIIVSIPLITGLVLAPFSNNADIVECISATAVAITKVNVVDSNKQTIIAMLYIPPHKLL